tara:strand:+ start:76 stop:1029 length:954 start_codon:yes stop_codon:yes gene_type:complete
MTLRLNGSSSGYTEIDAPAAAGNNTLTLPTGNGSANQFIKNGSTAGTLEYSSMVETSTGVGIGTTSPAMKAHLEGAAPYIRTKNTSAPFDEKTWDFNAGTDGTLRFRNTNDAANSSNNWLEVERDGVTTNSIKFLTGSGTQRMAIDDSGFITVGTQSASNAMLNVPVFSSGIGAITSETTVTTGIGHVRFKNPNGLVGSISTSGSGTSFVTSSDYRLKENVVDLESAIDRVKQLAPKRFNFIANADTTVDGFLAHEAQIVVPEAVTGTHNEVDEDGNPVMQGIDQSKLVPLLTAALQEAIAEIETLKTKVAALEAGS